ncbi:WXG100 family type VII secretion target [Actinopolyspora halophila]|uniref:WXG100 family type VII secretion target n=1 Tax=Actinopolyspora halophila TaxID=1850 RepID=UPI000360192F|nr:hypothetical protein [Actinopolyspora halophila]
MEPINTVVKGSVDSCRKAADMFGSLQSGVDEAGTGVHRARSESESCWQGEAGDAFRESLTKKGKHADDLAEASSRAEKALNKFADDLHTVTSMIDQARSVAQEHGLTVTPTTIEPPGPAPQPNIERCLPGSPVTGQISTEYMQAQAKYERQVTGYEEAKTTVQAAREKEQAAHKALEKAMNYDNGLLTSMKNGLGWTMVGVGHGLTTTPQISADTFRTKATMLYDKAAEAGKAADDTSLTAGQRSANAKQQEKYSKKAANAEKQSAKSQKIADRVNKRVKIGPDDARLLGKSVRGLPVVGTGITTGVQAEAVINDGKPVGKAGMNVLGGAAGGMLAGAAAGFVVGGPVGVLVGVGASAVGSGVGSWAAEQTYDAVTEGGD